MRQRPHPDQVLRFGEKAPDVLVVPVFDEKAMRAVVGRARGRLGRSSEQWLDETRALVEDAER